MVKKYKVCGKCGIKHNQWTKGTHCKSCVSGQKKEWYSRNKEVVKEKVSKNYDENKELKLEYAKRYRTKNKEKIKKYFDQNKTKIYKQRAKREATRRKEDLAYRLKFNLRHRLRQAINKNKKTLVTLDYLGCSIEELKTHLQKQFKDGMNWENYGSWHIDHIKPCDSFNMADLEQQRLCFHHSNLQPLWAIENIKKSNKIL